MPEQNHFDVNEVSICVRVGWQAHSLSNAGSNGSNRTMPRRQRLADGTETDAVTGNIQKRYQARWAAEYMKATGVYLCPACATGDGRRAAALADQTLTMADVLKCGLCDSHGFLVTTKNNNEKDDDSTPRPPLSKHSLVEFSFALALPDQNSTTSQLFTRHSGADGKGQMPIKKSIRSGQYGLCIRYHPAGIGFDTNTWQAVVTDPDERLRRHRANLHALRDTLLSPVGAMTSTLLPHLTGLTGAVVVRTTTGRAPLYSPLVDDFTEQLAALADDTCQVWSFTNLEQFNTVMKNLINRSRPMIPALGEVVHE